MVCAPRTRASRTSAGPHFRVVILNRRGIVCLARRERFPAGHGNGEHDHEEEPLT